MAEKLHCKSYYQVKNSNKRFVILQGGSRSGKSYSICEVLIEYAYANRGRNIVITIARKTLPTCKATIMRDFFEILKKEGLYLERNHNKTESTYRLYGNLIEFSSADDPQKIRGRKRAVLFLNEANEFTSEDFKQFAMRTEQKIIMDFNPSMVDHWLYDLMEDKKDEVELYLSTYHDNPFLTQGIINEIESLKYTDMQAYRVYALGERGVVDGIIFTNWEIGKADDPLWDNIHAGDETYGMDFGFSVDPTTLVWHRDSNHDPKVQKVYMRELIYSTGMLNKDIIAEMRNIGVRKGARIYADSAEPKSIEEIWRSGYNIHAARKGRDSIRKGIDSMKQKRMIIHPDSTNLIKELRFYRWDKDKNGKFLQEPIDAMNHCFVGDTLIRTDKGYCRIDEIEPGQRVLTSKGYRKVNKLFDNGKKRVYDIMIDLGGFKIYITCTIDHKVKTSKGFKPIGKLTAGDIIYIPDMGAESAPFIKPKTISAANQTEIVRPAIRRVPLLGKLVKPYQMVRVKNVVGGNRYRERVYDMEVDKVHEYFANGVLVHNCIDASRYNRVSLRNNRITVGSTSTYVPAPVIEELQPSWKDMTQEQREEQDELARKRFWAKLNA